MRIDSFISVFFYLTEKNKLEKYKIKKLKKQYNFKIVSSHKILKRGFDSFISVFFYKKQIIKKTVKISKNY